MRRIPKVFPRETVLFAGLFSGLLLTQAGEAHAMHVAEGLLPFGWSLFWYFAAAPFFFAGIARLNRATAEDLAAKPLAGLLAAAVLIISAMPIPVPFAGTCSHPCGTGISGIILGPFVSSVVAAAALLLQTLLLAHGGLSTLGANTFAMGVVGSLAGFVTFRLARGLGVNLPFAGFLAGLLADWATYGTTSLVLALGLQGGGDFWPVFMKIVLAFVPTQLPIGILEGAITAGMLSLLHKNRPDVLARMGVLGAGEARV